MLAPLAAVASSARHPQGPIANQIEHLTRQFLYVCIIVWIVVVAFMLVAMVRRYAREHPAVTPPEPLDPARERRLGFGVNFSIIATTIILFALLIADFSTARSIHEFAHKPNAVNIVLTGHQWWWEVRYDDEQPTNVITTANEIHIPAGRPIKIVLQSADVIHSFWIPSLTGKKDLIPQHSSEIWFQADVEGHYWGQCAEFCGYQHAKMRLLVIAEKPETFDAWLQAARTPARSPVDALQKKGQDVFMLRQCSTCHTIVGTPAGGRVGPDLTHVMNRYNLASGAIPNTPGHLAGWIIDPQTIKPGVRMPQNMLDPQDLQALLEYLRTLQ